MKAEDIRKQLAEIVGTCADPTCAYCARLRGGQVEQENEPMIPKEIETMEAGREMDALIAEHVFGWTDFGLLTPGFSTSIADAWRVVEKLREKRFRLSLFEVQTGKWAATFGCEPRDHYLYTDTAPLAICRAALRTAWAFTPQESVAALIPVSQEGK